MDIAEIEEAVTDELKKVPKRAIFCSFSTMQKPLYRPMELILNKKRYVSSSRVFNF